MWLQESSGCDKNEMQELEQRIQGDGFITIILDTVDIHPSRYLGGRKLSTISRDVFISTDRATVVNSRHLIGCVSQSPRIHDSVAI